jgi:2-polyprenyl-3-methyl-5-hydroxy-6-metoxy-1,4-benzoquinol methylase
MSRRFSWDLALDAAGRTLTRLTGHYQPVASGDVTSAYFCGDNYADYDAESESSYAMLDALFAQFPFAGRALDVGCATGGTVDFLTRRQIDAVGIDFSEWAIEQARTRVGDRVWRADVDREPLPPPVVARAPFDAIVMMSVLEHFGEPRAALERLTGVSRSGTRLFITTTNAASLAHQVFGSDWEGYFDWTHRGVHLVSVTSLRSWLDDLGWRVDRLDTEIVWDRSTDPSHATLRDWWHGDARFRQLLAEKDLGDFLTCVATRI